MYPCVMIAQHAWTVFSKPCACFLLNIYKEEDIIHHKSGSTQFLFVCDQEVLGDYYLLHRITSGNAYVRLIPWTRVTCMSSPIWWFWLDAQSPTSYCCMYKNEWHFRPDMVSKRQLWLYHDVLAKTDVNIVWWNLFTKNIFLLFSVTNWVILWWYFLMLVVEF